MKLSFKARALAAAVILATGFAVAHTAEAKEFYHSTDSYPGVYNSGADNKDAFGNRADWRDSDEPSYYGDGSASHRGAYYDNRDNTRDDGRWERNHVRYDHATNPYVYNTQPTTTVVQTFNGPDRSVIYDYMVNSYGMDCPDGLVQWHNRCVRPGQVRAMYHIGRPLPQTVTYTEVPQPLMTQIQPAPAGYHYVSVDGDVLLVSDRDNRVTDAVTLTSAYR